MSEIITLDSNVFRNQRFIDWLISPETIHITHFFPLIVYIEVLVWYEMRGLTRDDFEDDLTKMKNRIIEFSIEYIDPLMANIRSNPDFLFRHHARDYLIGTIVQETGSVLITNNQRHFAWLTTSEVLTPETYLTKYLSKNQTDDSL